MSASAGSPAGGAGGPGDVMLPDATLGFQPSNPKLPEAGIPAAPSGDDDDAGTDADPLCDGSSKMRLVYGVHTGFDWTPFVFKRSYGDAFLMVDGSCRFFASSDYRQGIVTGVLSAPDAARLSSELHFADLAGSWSKWRDDSCPDGGFVGLSREHGSVACACGCGAGVPKGVEQALSKANDWVGELKSKGKLLDGALGALATAARVPLDTYSDWPLMRHLDSITNLVFSSSVSPVASTPQTAHIDDPNETMKLRALRKTYESAVDIPIRDEDKYYELLVRDELPDDAEAAYDAMQP
jgi:hypothetical protein